MCQSNAYCDSNCNHDYDKLDRMICDSVLFLYGGTGVVRGSIFKVVKKNLNKVLPWWTEGTWNDKGLLRVISSRLQVLKNQGYLKGPVSWFDVRWYPTDMLKDKYTAFHTRAA